MNETTWLNSITSITLIDDRSVVCEIPDLPLYQNLTALDASGTCFDDSGMSSIASLQKLETLILKDTKITDDGLNSLSELSCLCHVVLAENGLTDLGMRNIALLKNLKFLDLSETGACALVYLAELPVLQWLDLDRTQISDTSLQHLASLSHLTTLILSHTRVTDFGLPHLYTMTNLKVIELSFAEVTDDGLDRLRRALPDCRVCAIEFDEQNIPHPQQPIPPSENVMNTFRASISVSFVCAVILGLAAVILPVWLLSLRPHTAPLFPLFRTGIEGLSILTIVFLFVSGLLLGLFGRGHPFLLGIATMVLFPLLAIAEMFVSATSHNMWPLEFVFYGFVSLSAVLGAFIGRFLQRNVGKSDALT